MSEENVEIVRRFFQESDSEMDVVSQLWASDLDYRAIEGAPDDVGVFHGHEALRHYYQQWYETFDDFGVEAEVLTEAGEKVVAAVYISGRMRNGGARIDMRLGIVFTLRNGEIISGREFATRELALEAAGLSE